MKILWFVSTFEDTNFLKEFARNFEGVIDVFHLNVLTRLGLLGSAFIHFYPVGGRRSTVSGVDLNKSFNVLAGRLNKRDAMLAYASTLNVLNKNKESLKDAVFIIPSGRHVHHMAAREFASKHGLKSIYINYSNFPGYTFFDPSGTDCLSSIYKDPARIDRLYPKPIDSREIFDKFSKLKECQVAIPQAPKSGGGEKLKHMAFFLDTFIQKLSGFYGDRRIDFSSDKKKREVDIKYDDTTNESSYFFFPLQVSTDQQVLVNYNGGSIFKAIDQAIGVAEEAKRLLFVREHPAESMKDDVRSYLIKKRLECKCLRIVDASVHELIEGSEKVVTINSTVGLESRLKSKEVIFLGRSFYEKSSDQQLAKYLEKYFVAVDYHKPKLDREKVEKILMYSEYEKS